MPIDRIFDAVVIGGGPAGLTGALYLARFRRTVLLVDEGRSRAARIPRAHNYPGFAEGIEGAMLVAAMQHQALRHGVNFAVGRATSIERKLSGFEVVWGGGRAAARSVLLTTGISDIEPVMPHLADAVRDGTLRYCPPCDAYEIIDQAVGVVTDGAKGVAEALFLRHFTARVTLFLTRRNAGVTDEDRARLADAGVTFVEEPTRAIRWRDGTIVIVHGEHETVCDSLYCALGVYVHSELALRIGARRDDEGFLLIDDHHETSVEGLYAAGDVVRGLNQITVATGGATVAASEMHRALLASDPKPSSEPAGAGARSAADGVSPPSAPGDSSTGPARVGGGEPPAAAPMPASVGAEHADPDAAAAKATH